MTEERVLIARAARGERAAFASLVSAHRPTVLRIARSVLSDEADAEDVAQDVFVGLYLSIARFRGDAELATWLYRATLNGCTDRLRSKKRRGTELPVSEAQDDEMFRDASAVDVAIDRARARRAVRAAIERLPPDMREVVVLRYIDDLPYADIAERTGVPQGTVASRVFRALERLGRDLEPRHLEVIK